MPKINIKPFFLFLLFILFCGHSLTAFATKNEKYCRIDGPYRPPAKQCAIIFIKQLNHLSFKKKKEYAKQLELLKQHNTYEFYLFLSYDYPIPQLLYKIEQISEDINRDTMSSRNLAIDNPETVYLYFESDANVYEVIVEMLKKQKNLSHEDQHILKVSQQRSQCMNKMLSEIKKSNVEEVKVEALIKRCYL